MAVSGGPDSMALAHAVFCFFDMANIHFICVNHGLRESVHREIEQVQQWVEGLGRDNVSLSVLTWEGDKPQNALMENARTARYDLMERYCAEHDIQSLFVGHHLDDQAETFLIRLSKGSGLDGLACMPTIHQKKSVQIVRPFLSCAKADLIKYCTKNDVLFSNDPSNKNEDYMRPRLRQSQAILEAEGLSAKRLSMTAKRIRRAREALEEISIAAYEDGIIDDMKTLQTLDITVLEKFPDEIIFRVFHHALKKIRVDKPYNVRMEKLEDLFETLWFDIEKFKPRTLGGVKISVNLKKKKILTLEQE